MVLSISVSNSYTGDKFDSRSTDIRIQSLSAFSDSGISSTGIIFRKHSSFRNFVGKYFDK